MKEQTVLILAGGYATRLNPLTLHTPKSLLSFAGKPFLMHQLQHLKLQGVKKVVLALAHQHQLILECLENTNIEGLEIKCSVEQTPSGTAGAIKAALPLLEDSFFVLYGDSFLFCDFAKMMQHFIGTKSVAMMSVYKNLNQRDKSNVLFQEGELVAYNKKDPSANMQHIDYGLSLFNKELFLECAHDDLSDFFSQLATEKKLSAFEVYQPFFEIGSFSGIKNFKDYIING